MTRIALVAVLAVVLGAPTAAHAFCGLYVATGDQPMFNDATQVVLMRKGTRTVVSMQNHYKGPIEAFALVIPVPGVVREGDVKTLTPDVFDVVEKMGAPRLVEYWEQDPCKPDERDARANGSGSRTAADAAPNNGDSLGVTIESQFTVAEYQIVIVSAKDATGLDAWLRKEKYNVPDTAEPQLRPYVDSGMKFFVAKVDPKKVKFEGDRAVLSPLRFHYDSEKLTLPIRLGLANSSGTQDLIVNVLAPHQRYEAANYKNVTIPTNLDVASSARDKFSAFYAALFDATLDKHPGAVVTEYVWDAKGCEPCPGPALTDQNLQTLGADVLDGPAATPTAYGGDFVLTRLHARYGKSIGDDLELREAPPIAGGREHIASDGKLEEGAQLSSVNRFQARYIIRHAWMGPITCTNPVRGRWGGHADTRVQPALDLAFAPRGDVKLADVVAQSVPELDLNVLDSALTMTPGAPARGPEKRSGCGCQSSDPSGGLLVGLVALLVRRRRAVSR